jgi:hypothetical protein
MLKNGCWQLLDEEEGEEDGYQVAIILSSHTAHYLPSPPPLPLLCACLKEYF